MDSTRTEIRSPLRMIRKTCPKRNMRAPTRNSFSRELITEIRISLMKALKGVFRVSLATWLITGVLAGF